MNAAGLTFVLGGVSAALNMAFYQTLVTDGDIRQDELDGTRSELAALLRTLKNTPDDKIEAMVAQFNDDLTVRLNSFNKDWGMNPLAEFRDAQVLAGYVTTIMAKSGLSE